MESSGSGMSQVLGRLPKFFEEINRVFRLGLIRDQRNGV